MMVMVVPKLLDIFENKDALPASTKALIATSDFFVNYWMFIIIFFILIVSFIKVWKKTPSGIYNYDLILLKIPVF